MSRFLKSLIYSKRVTPMKSASIAILLICLLGGFRMTAGIVSGSVNNTRGDEFGLPLADDPSGATTGVPDYNLMTLKGSEMRLSSLRGKVILLDIFRSTCPHCQAHAPFISDITKRYRDRNLTVAGLSTDNYYVDYESVKKYVSDAKIDMQIMFAPFDIVKLYLAQDEHLGYFVPQAILFDKEGRFIARFTRWEEKDQLEIERAIAGALSK